MTLAPLKDGFGSGGSGLTDGALKAVLTELRGLSFSLLPAGPTDTAPVAVTGMKAEDTLIFLMGFDLDAAQEADKLADLTAGASIVQTGDDSGKLAHTTDVSAYACLAVWYDKA